MRARQNQNEADNIPAAPRYAPEPAGRANRCNQKIRTARIGRRSKGRGESLAGRRPLSKDCKKPNHAPTGGQRSGLLVAKFSFSCRVYRASEATLHNRKDVRRSRDVRDPEWPLESRADFLQTLGKSSFSLTARLPMGSVARTLPSTSLRAGFCPRSRR